MFDILEVRCAFHVDAPLGKDYTSGLSARVRIGKHSNQALTWRLWLSMTQYIVE